ncbi:MAG: FHA domain-containing protein [Chitinophagales bacterium]
MAKVKCYNCKKTTAVVAPRYRCKFCNYPLNKYVEQEEEPKEEVVIENIKQEYEDEGGVNEVFRKNQLEKGKDNYQKLLEKLNIKPKSDEKVESLETGPIIIKQNLNPEKDGKIVAGWLVVHTEGKKTTTYELYEGKNIIGRPDGPHHVDIRIEEDEYVSRVHAVIRIEKDFLHRFTYRLLDDGSLRNGHPSTNGVYVNGISERLPKKANVLLRDGDTIQIGITKLVFKNTDKADSYRTAANSVAESNFVNTVAIR